jgi:hypothetical protein
VSADAKLYLAKGIPIPLLDHVVSLKSNTTDPAPSVALESSSSPIQPNALGPSVAPTTAAPSGARPIDARVVAPSGTADLADLFHVFEPEEDVRLSLEASQPTG